MWIGPQRVGLQYVIVVFQDQSNCFKLDNTV